MLQKQKQSLHNMCDSIYRPAKAVISVNAQILKDGKKLYSRLLSQGSQTIPTVCTPSDRSLERALFSRL
jgi:hypothetical protein